MSDYFAREIAGCYSIVCDDEIVCCNMPLKFALESLNDFTGEHHTRIEVCEPSAWLVAFLIALEKLAPPELSNLINQERTRVRFEIQHLSREVLQPKQVESDGFKGQWNRGITYFPGDSVSLDGCVWICKKTANGKPSQSNSAWEAVSNRAMAGV
jgi:hypothetical protein